MKKIFTLLAAFSLSALAFGQVTVTYQVDVTNYLAGGTALNANGIRVGGNFTDNSGTVTAGAVANWSPSDANSAMTDLGGNLWSITVTYPSASVGATQVYKFVNGDWGTNEGTDTSNTIASGGCGTDDGSGNINRTLVIPAADTTVTFCWDACTVCNLGLENNTVNVVAVSPNPAMDQVTFSNVAAGATITMFDLSGKVVMSAVAASTTTEMNIAALEVGTYIYRVNAGDVVSTGKVVKK
jgi:hypothetical protein